MKPTLFEDFLAKEQDWIRGSLHLEGTRRGGVRPRPEHPALAVALGVDPAPCGGQHHPSLHERQQGGQSLVSGPSLWAGRHVGGGLREQDAGEPPDYPRGSDWRGRHVGDADVVAHDLSAEHLLAYVAH